MRIGIAYDCIFPFDTGGGERVYRAMADQLTDRGHDVTYLTRVHKGGYPGAVFRVVEVSSGRIYDSAGDRTTLGALHFAWGVFRHLVAHRRNYDLLIVSALPVLTLLAARVAMLGARASLVADWLEVWSWRKWREYSGGAVGTVAAVLQWFGARATRTNTVNSRFTAQRLLAINRHATPIVLGLFDLAADSASVQAAASPPVALFVGRWIADKRIPSLPAAIVHARSRVPDLTCSIVGSGSEEGAIRSAIDSASAAEFVTVLGRIDDAAHDVQLSSAAVLVNPSAREGFGLVITEAASRGVPVVVVAGEDNASVELLSVGVNGFIAADTSPIALGDAIADAVLAGPALRTSSASWFVAERASATLSHSLDAILSARSTPSST